MKHPFLIFLLLFAVFFAALYFYPADIFEAEITDNVLIYKKEITLNNFINSEDFLKNLSSNKAESVNLTPKGWFLLVIILIALPIMIAYRTTLKKYPRKSKS